MPEFQLRVICSVSNEIRIKVLELYNIDVENFQYSIDSDGRVHAEKGHSGSKRVLRENEVPVQGEDFENLNTYINNSVEVVGGGISRSRKLPTIMHIYEKEEVKVYIVFEILNKKKELRFKTMYKNLK